MAEKILAVLEQREGQIKKVSYEVLTLSNKLSMQLSTITEAIIIGDQISNISELKQYTNNKIIHFQNTQLNYYSSSAYAKIISEYADSNQFSLILFPNTAMGIDLAPRVAVRTNSSIATDVTNIDIFNGELIITKPVYAGKSILNFKLNSVKKVLTIRPNIFKAEKLINNTAEIEVKDVTELDLKTKVISYKKSDGKLDLTEADIIVSGGRGMKGPENFYLIEQLANELGGAVGASRAVVDAGWRPHSQQVGQTGKTVSPKLYIACGISGAIQHLAGMSSSKYIVAINKDKDAPIFNVADYGIVADALDVLPVLIENIKKLKS